MTSPTPTPAPPSEMELGMGCLLFMMGVPLGIFVGVPLKAWTLTVLWGWFAVPAFNLSPLSMFQAIAISLVASFILYRAPDHKDERPLSEQMKTGIVMMFLHPALSLLFGWIILKIYT